MFGKLLKYEFKNVNKWYLGIYGAILALSVVIGLWFNGIVDKLNQTYQNLDTIDRFTPMDGPSSTVTVILFLIFFTLTIVLAISTFFLIVRRFKNSVYDRQGYLTLTLPVSHHQIILSKLTGAIIWSLLSTLTLLLSGLVILGIVYISHPVPLPSLDQVLLRLLDVNVAQFMLYILVSSIEGCLVIYFSISIGQLFQDYRTAIAVLAYVGIGIATSILTMSLGDLIAGNLLALTTLDTIQALIYYFGTYYILKNKVNLQ